MNTPLAYWTAVAVGVVIAAGLCVACRRRPGRWVPWAGRAIAVTLAVDALLFLGRPFVEGGWSVRTSLPLALCHVALVVAAIACWWPGWRLGVELTYFWGLAGTLQAVITPDLSAGFPQLEFFQFVVGHIGIVVAALYLVVGLRIEPRPGAVTRVFGITVAYAVLLGLFDWATGANYMYLAAPPDRPTLLSVLGPWPWYLLSATAVAFVLLVLLDLPFRRSRRRAPVHIPSAPAHENGADSSRRRSLTAERRGDLQGAAGLGRPSGLRRPRPGLEGGSAQRIRPGR